MWRGNSSRSSLSRWGAAFAEIAYVATTRAWDFTQDTCEPLIQRQFTYVMPWRL